MAEGGRVLSEVMDGVALLTFAGADPHNQLTQPMWQAFADAVRRCAEDAAVRVLVLTGAGHVAFATDAGQADPALAPGSQPEGHGAQDAAEAARAACAALAGCEKPVIARLRGECIGAGLVLALHADLRVAARDFDFALAPERAAALGAEPLLLRAVGDTAARYLLLTGARIDADEALRIGLVSRVVADAALSDTVADLARGMADQEPDRLHAAKQAIRAGA